MSVGTLANSRASMAFIMVAVLLDMVTVGIILPVLPAWVRQFTADPREGALWYGLVTFSFGCANFLAAPILGGLSDHFGRRPILLLGIVGMSCSLLITAFAGALWMLVAARALAGATQANLAVANAYVADITDPESRWERFGWLGAMMGLGMTIGPAIGGAFYQIDRRLPFLIAAGLAGCNALYGFFVLPESLPRSARDRPGTERRMMAALAPLPQGGRLGWLVPTIGVNTLAQSAFATGWVLYTQYRFGWGPRDSGLSMLAIGVAALAVQGGAMQPVRKRLGEAALGLIGICSATLAYLLFGLAASVWALLPVILLHATGYASAAALQSQVTRGSDMALQGRTFGAIASVNALAGMAAPLLSAGVLSSVAALPARDWRVGMPMFLCAAIECVAAALLLSNFRTTTR